MVDEPLAPVASGIDDETWWTVCESVRAYCGWHIAPSITETITVDGSAGPTLFLPTLHLTEVSSIVNNGTTVDLTLVDDWDWSAHGTVRLYTDNFTWRHGKVEVTFTHGLPYCPADLVEVITKVARQAATAPASGAARMMAGPYQIDWPQTLLAGSMAFSELQIPILDRYKLPARL